MPWVPLLILISAAFSAFGWLTAITASGVAVWVGLAIGAANAMGSVLLGVSTYLGRPRRKRQ